MNVVLWLVLCGIIGGVVGWMASLAIRPDDTQRVVANISFGALGAMVATCLLSPDFGTSLFNRGAIPLNSIVAACLGALATVSVLRFTWHRRGI